MSPGKIGDIRIMDDRVEVDISLTRKEAVGHDRYCLERDEVILTLIGSDGTPFFEEKLQMRGRDSFEITMGFGQ